MDKDKLQEIKKLLQYIYDHDTADRIWDDVVSLLESCPLGKGQTVLTNKDALLLTYGDMLAPSPSGKETKGLERLSDFLRKWNQDAFSYVHLLPFHPSSSDDGYAITDYRCVHKDLGSWEDIEKLGNEANLVFDFVLNHGSTQGQWFEQFLNNDEKYKKWFITKPWDYDDSQVIRPRTSPLLTHFVKKDGSLEYVWTTFSADQADYDFSNPGVLLEFITLFGEYERRGAKMIRFDAVAYLWKEDGTSCRNHPKTHALVKLFRAIIDALRLDLKIITETNVPHDQNISYFGNGDEAHLVCNYPLAPLVLHAVISGDALPLRNWAKKLFPLKTGECFLNFLIGHNGIGLLPARGLINEEAFNATLNEAKKRGALISYKTTLSGTHAPYELNCSLASLFAPESMGSVELRARAFMSIEALLLALPGLPEIYFHSFFGSEAWKQGPSLLGYNRAINREKVRIEEVEQVLEDPYSFRSHVYRTFRKLLDFRRQEEAFMPDAGFILLEGDNTVFALVRGPDSGGRYVLCAQNLSGKEALFTIPAEYHFIGEEASCTLQPWESLWTASGGEKTVRRLSTAVPISPQSSATKR